MSEELKRCPFCGGEPEMIHAVLKEYYSVNPEIICKKCGYSIKAMDLAININYSPEENCAFMDNQTIPIWNTRPEEERLKAENDRLKEELEELRYIVEQFRAWYNENGCPKHFDCDFPCSAETEYKNDPETEGDFDERDCWKEEHENGCWVEYYRWKYRQKLGTDKNVLTNAPDMDDGRKTEINGENVK